MFCQLRKWSNIDYMDKDIWTFLSETRQPVVIYGTGDGADKLFSILEDLHVRVRAVFASPGFVRSRTFHGYKVRSFEDCLAEYGREMVVLMVFGSRDPEVMSYILHVAECCTLLIPDLLFDEDHKPFRTEYASRHAREIEKAYRRLGDEESRKVFEAAIRNKLTGSTEELMKGVSDERENWKLLQIREGDSFFDAGAYNGDTLSLFLSFTENYGRIYACEPDPKSFRRLKARAEGLRDTELYQAAVSECPGTMNFTFGKGRGNAKGGNGVIRAESIDSILRGRSVSVIKYDIEGEEERGLKGAASTIREYRPRILLSAYHKTDDLWVLPKVVGAIRDDYTYLLRRSVCMPLWDLSYFLI